MLRQQQEINKDKHLFFHKYDRMRVAEKFTYDETTKLNNRTCTDGDLLKIKDDVVDNIKTIRHGRDDEDKAEQESKRKQVKFLNFILHLGERAAFRMWKEATFGTGADPRYQVLMDERRNRVRDYCFRPVWETKRQIVKTKQEI